MIHIFLFTYVFIFFYLIYIQMVNFFIIFKKNGSNMLIKPWN